MEAVVQNSTISWHAGAGTMESKDLPLDARRVPVKKFTVTSPRTGRTLTFTYSRTEFDDIEGEGLYMEYHSGSVGITVWFPRGE